MAWREGMRVVHRAQRGWGVGVVVQVAEEGRRLAVRFAGREGVTVVSGRDPALAEVPPETPLESGPARGPFDALLQGSPGKAAAFRLRTRVVRLEALRRADSLGALLSSRVHVLPHQVGAAGRILSDRMPRFVLADEVGLGKTVEAGLVFAGLRQLGIAERVLVVAPGHLAFQWLAELFHKFNALFTLLTRERIASLGGAEAALARSPHAIVSFESLLEDPDLARAAAGLPLDLVVVDEAHHLAEDRLHARVAPLCRSSFGVLLLTATPVRLDPSEYFRLLALVEPLPSESLEAFLRRLERHEDYAEVARALLAGGDVETARDRLRALAPEDGFLGAPRGREELLAHLSDRHGLSARLIRNRRVKVGAFTARVPRRRDVPRGGKPAALVRLCADLARAGEKVLAVGHDLGALRALQEGLAREGLEALLYDDAPSIEARDRLVARFRDADGPMVLLSGESGGEGRNFQFACHLVCVDLPDSPLILEQRIGRLDRLGQSRPVEIHVVAEPGEEAFLADLYEREIGIFEEPVGGLDAVLARLPEELDALRRRRTERTREAFRADLAGRVAAARRAQHEGDPLLDVRSASLPELVSLVRRSFARLGEEPPPEIDALFAADEAAGGPATGSPAALPTAEVIEALEHALVALARWLEEELEEVVVEAGRRLGLEADTDQNVHPFEVAFTLGASMHVEALPGMVIPEENETWLGSFWRETAVARDELHWLATGHRLVEALLQVVRDGAAGRSAAVRREWAPRGGALYARFEPVLATSAEVARGARVASRQASRYLDLSPVALLVDLAPGHRAIGGGAERLEAEIEEAEEARTGPVPAAALEPAHAAAAEKAHRVLEARKQEAVERLVGHALAEEERLVEAARAGGAPPAAVEAAVEALRHHRDVTALAIERARLDLDAVALVVP
jgi:ATP-dependent helicase HepA